MLGLLLLALAQIPTAAWEYRGEMARSAYRVHGPSAPIATLAAQIHQESGWRTSVTSWAGAQGLAQFMPATARDMGRLYPADCAPVNPFRPQWAFACRDRYMASRLREVRKPVGTGPVSTCAAWSFALRAYNGGLGWIQRDRRLALTLGLDPDDWEAMREANAGRRESAIRENREYPERIHRIAERYHAAGWGARACSEPPRPVLTTGGTDGD